MHIFHKFNNETSLQKNIFIISSSGGIIRHACEIQNPQV